MPYHPTNPTAYELNMLKNEIEKVIKLEQTLKFCIPLCRKALRHFGGGIGIPLS